MHSTIDLPTRREETPRLPAAVFDLALRLGADPTRPLQHIELTQTGRMKLSLEAKRWTPFTARQSISVQACAFDWRARMAPFGAISVRDAFQNGEGQLSVKALGSIPIARAKRSSALTRGELMRYLAELAWAPDAILHNSALRWREIDADSIAVSAGSGDGAAEVVFTLDGEGRIANCYAPDRPRSTTAPFLPTPWPCRYADYRRHAGRWLPFTGEAAWVIEGDELAYWQGHLKTWALLPAAKE